MGGALQCTDGIPHGFHGFQVDYTGEGKDLRKADQQETLQTDGKGCVSLSSDNIPLVHSFPGLLLASEQVGCPSYHSSLPNDTY